MKNIPLVGLFDQYQTIKPEIDAAIENIITKSAFVGGEEVRSFEAEFAAYCETKSCVGVGNGTDAIYLTLRAMGVGPEWAVSPRATTFIPRTSYDPVTTPTRMPLASRIGPCSMWSSK